MEQVESHSATQRVLGRWVSEKVYSELHSISRQTLTNWRYRDRLAGLSEAAPGYPRYKRFGRAVRYWLPEDPQ